MRVTHQLLYEILRELRNNEAILLGCKQKSHILYVTPSISKLGDLKVVLWKSEAVILHMLLNQEHLEV